MSKGRSSECDIPTLIRMTGRRGGEPEAPAPPIGPWWPVWTPYAGSALLPRIQPQATTQGDWWIHKAWLVQRRPRARKVLRDADSTLRRFPMGLVPKSKRQELSVISVLLVSMCMTSICPASHP